VPEKLPPPPPPTATALTEVTPAGATQVYEVAGVVYDCDPGATCVVAVPVDEL
jgi:hypothetical protein